MINGNFNMKNLHGFKKPFSRFKFKGTSFYLNCHFDNYFGTGRRFRKVFEKNIDTCVYRYCLKSLSYFCVTNLQLESARRIIIKIVGKKIKLDIRICAFMPVTKKSQGSRMGKGKGKFNYWVSIIKPGQLIFELSGSKFSLAKQALRKASNKFPKKLRFFIGRDLPL
jgi:large subunit ribosomal protein L16